MKYVFEVKSRQELKELRDRLNLLIAAPAAQEPSTRVEDAEFSVRVRSVLTLRQLVTLADITKVTATCIRQNWGIGAKGLREIEDALREAGLELAKE